MGKPILVFSALPSEVKVIVGDNSVIIMEPDEEIISVFEIYIYDYLGEVYDPVNKLHDIALLEVIHSFYKFVLSQSLIFFMGII